MKYLKERILDDFPDMDDTFFAHHDTDLYIKQYAGISAWLSVNYAFHNQITLFRSPIDGCIWLELPFAWRDKMAVSYRPAKGGA